MLEKPLSIFLKTWGCLIKVNLSNLEKRAWTKALECVF
jgi:hypothetical protein